MAKNITNMTPEEIENLETLGLDDTFTFRCKACGKCCKNRKDIILSAYDLFRLARYLGRTPEEFVDRYCEVYEGQNSHYPIVWLKPVAPDASCPFLRSKRCSVHSAKPCVCRVYPLARMYTLEGPPRYYNNGSTCAHAAQSVKVRDWIGDFATEESECAGRLWTDAAFCLTTSISPDKYVCSYKQRQQINNEIFAMLWLPYDTKEPFLPQFERNNETLRAFLSAKYSLEIPNIDGLIKKYKKEYNYGPTAHSNI